MAWGRALERGRGRAVGRVELLLAKGRCKDWMTKGSGGLGDEVWEWMECRRVLGRKVEALDVQCRRGEARENSRKEGNGRMGEGPQNLKTSSFIQENPKISS